MTRWMRKLHKWVGLILALQFVLWMASGLIMSLLDYDKLQGHHHQAEQVERATDWPAGLLAPSDVLTSESRSSRSVETLWFRERPVYRLSDSTTTWLVDASDGRRIQIDSDTALAIAKADYRGTGRVAAPELLRAPTLEVRRHAAPIWRVGFDDKDATTLYVSGQDGSILERRNNTWRLFDIAWMLHIMDYSARDDFNNPLVVTAAAGGLWIALTGVWLLIASLRLRRTSTAKAVA